MGDLSLGLPSTLHAITHLRAVWAGYECRTCKWRGLGIGADTLA